MSLSDDAVSLASQPRPMSMERWRMDGVKPVVFYPPPEPEFWIGGQFFYHHWLVEQMNEADREFAENLALSIRGGSQAVWIEHASCWEVRAVR